jgi:hypothetical protein
MLLAGLALHAECNRYKQEVWKDRLQPEESLRHRWGHSLSIAALGLLGIEGGVQEYLGTGNPCVTSVVKVEKTMKWYRNLSITLIDGSW